MPDLLAWLTAVVAVGSALLPVGWYGIALYRRHAEELEALRIEQAKIRHELYGVNGDNGLKGRVAVLGERTHDIPAIKQVMLWVEETVNRRREG